MSTLNNNANANVPINTITERKDAKRIIKDTC